MRVLSCCISIAVVLAATQICQGELLSGPDIIPAPASVIDDPPGAINKAQQGFNERQNVLLTEDLPVDDGVIPAGTLVNSHMIFLNTRGYREVNDPDVIWAFDGPVLGVMSDPRGELEGASNGLLGAQETQYPGTFNGRGFEPNTEDYYLVLEDTISVGMVASEPGDWVRVVTAAEVPCVPVEDPDPRGLGFWKRQCRGPHPAGEFDLLPDYVAEVASTGTFAYVTNADDMCDALYPYPQWDKCAHAEAHFMTLLLNVASGRLAECNVVDVFGLGEATVGETIDFIDELLSNPDRTRRDCLVAMVMANQARIGVRLMPSDMDAE